MKIGLVGWRGMVGSVFMKRMNQENGFNNLSYHRHELEIFSSDKNSIGQKKMIESFGELTIGDSYNLKALAKCDLIVTCQGSDWSKKIYPELEKEKWRGIWIDASSAFREREDCTIVLDPINGEQIAKALKKGQTIFAGGNCTVSLMLMALAGLFKKGLIASVNSDTYQAASGAGSKHMKELIAQMLYVSSKCDIRNEKLTALDLEKRFTSLMRDFDLPRENFGYPLVGNVLPFIDSEMENGQSREEFKGLFETNKILGSKRHIIPIDGTCVRVGSMRCHAQALTINLTKDIPLNEIEAMISQAHEWVKVIPNTKADTLSDLTPEAVTGTLNIHIGRLRKLAFGPRYLGAFTVGDQLLWGAAEPIRRILMHIARL